jgi:hypothetical protein
MAPSPVNVTGKRGQTVNGGSFTLTSTQNTVERLGSVSITVTNPSELSSLTLTASTAGGEVTANATVTPVNSTSVFNFVPPFLIPPNATVNFSLSAVISGAAKRAPAVMSSDANDSGGGFIRTGFVTGSTLGVASSAQGIRMLASAILPMLVPMLLVTLVFQSGIRQRMMAMGFGMMLATLTMTGCDPCPKCVEAKKPSTVQTVVAVSVTDPSGNQLSFTGLPQTLSQITRQ